MKRQTFGKIKLRGQTLTEYLILTALVAVCSIGILQLFSGNLRKQMTNVSNALVGGRNQKVTGTRAESRHYELRDLGDFSDGNHQSE